jgi:RNA polymerase-binding transcription factor DksA
MDERVLEIAEALTNALVDNSVAQICATVKKRDPSFDGLCDDCTEAIPEARLETGAIRCIECQEVLEKRQAQFRR